jgi:hypothetical protein
MKFSLFTIIDIVFLGSIFTIMSLFKTHKQPEEAPKPIEIPSTEIGQPIKVLFGTRVIKNPVLVDYGDVSIIKVEVDPQGKK